MSLEIHPDCRKRLVEKLAERLPEIVVVNGQFLDYMSTGRLFEVDRSLPKGKLEEFSNLIGEWPLSSFIRGAIALRIAQTEQYTSQDNPTPLVKLPAYSDAESVAASLMDEFLSLPWRYALTIPLPQSIVPFFVQTVPTFALSTNFRIVTPDAGFANEYEPPPAEIGTVPITLGNLMTSGFPTHAWDHNKTYLQLQVEGFIPPHGNSAALASGTSDIKSFYGLGAAHNLFAVEDRRFDDPSPKESFWVHRRAEDKWTFQRRAELDFTLSGILHSLRLHEDLSTLSSPDQQKALATTILGAISTVFAAGAVGTRILLASEWHLDSFGGPDEMLSFVQSAVVLEILLGDKAASDVIGLGELLRNRCAYLISRSHAERKQLLDDFTQIYNVRSKIVHAGKKRLNRTELGLFFKLRDICQRVIREEATLISKTRA